MVFWALVGSNVRKDCFVKYGGAWRTKLFGSARIVAAKAEAVRDGEPIAIGTWLSREADAGRDFAGDRATARAGNYGLVSFSDSQCPESGSEHLPGLAVLAGAWRICGVSIAARGRD